MSWFLDILDPANKEGATAAVLAAPAEVSQKLSTPTKVVLGVGVATALFAVWASTSRKSYAKGAASRGGTEVERKGLELALFGKRQAETAQRVKRAEASAALATRLAQARLAAVKGG